MAGRMRRPRGRRSRRPKQVKVPTNMYVADTTLDVSSKAALSDTLFTIFDNSGTAGNKTIVFTKLTVSWCYYGNTSVLAIVAVGRQKEGGAALDLDDATAVRDYINENHMLRGPWMIVSKTYGRQDQKHAVKQKTMVFKKLMLDANDDLVLHYTPLEAHGVTEEFHMYYKGFFRIVD